MKKTNALNEVIHLLEKGKSKAEIKDILGISSTTLSNRLRRLKDLGRIKFNGKFLVSLIPSSHNNPKVTKNKVHIDLNKRGHGHNLTIHFHKKTQLKLLPKVKEDKKLGILEELGFGSLKFIKDGFTIWINTNNLTIYSNNSYYSNNAIHSKFRLLRDIDNLVEYLVLKYNFPKSYGVEVFREHYGLIFNKFAKWLIKKGKKMYVKDKRGKSILWVDKSMKDDIGLEEFEGEDPIIINNADTFFDSHEKHKFKVDADYTLKAINKLIAAQLESSLQLTKYEEQNKEHLKLIQLYKEESEFNKKVMLKILEKFENE